MSRVVNEKMIGGRGRQELKMELAERFWDASRTVRAKLLV